MPASFGHHHAPRTGAYPPHRHTFPAGSTRTPGADAKARRRVPRDRSRWHWLLVVPATAPLLTPLYDRAEPRLWGIPFFYWAQLAGIGLTVMVTTLVFLLTRPRG